MTTSNEKDREQHCTICGGETLLGHKFKCICPERQEDGTWIPSNEKTGCCEKCEDIVWVRPNTAVGAYKKCLNPSCECHSGGEFTGMNTQIPYKEPLEFEDPPLSDWKEELELRAAKWMFIIATDTEKVGKWNIVFKEIQSFISVRIERERKEAAAKERSYQLIECRKDMEKAVQAEKSRIKTALMGLKKDRALNHLGQDTEFNKSVDIHNLAIDAALEVIGPQEGNTN